MSNSSFADTPDRQSELFALESITPEKLQSIINSDSLTNKRIVDLDSINSNQPPIVVANPSTENKLDVTNEIESLLEALAIAEPHPPNSGSAEDSISDVLAQIAAAKSLSSGEQLLAEIRIANEQLASGQVELHSLYQRNQGQIDTINNSVLQVKQVKFQTQQLARHSQNQVQKVENLLESFDRIRTEIATNLEKFGGYSEIQAMLRQLQETRQALIIADDRLKTGQEAFYDSLRVIQQQAADTGLNSEHKLTGYQESIQSLINNISDDRDRIAVTSVDLTLKLADLNKLSNEIITIHDRITEKSQTLEGNIANINGSFVELAQSVKMEKEKFNQLASGTINKAEIIRSEFANIADRIGIDRAKIEHLKTEIESIPHQIDPEIQQQLNHFDEQYQDLITTWSDMQVRQKAFNRQAEQFSFWLWILSVGVGLCFILFAIIMIHLR